MINCKDKKCDQGFSRCCATCEMLEICPNSCEHPSVRCEFAEITPTENRKMNKSNKRFKRLLMAYIILLILFIAGGAFIIGNLNLIHITQYDTLDQLNYIRQEVESINSTQENVSEVKIEPEKLTPNERELVQRIVAAEARGEGIQGQMAVAQTIRDRSEFWDMSITEVCTADGQYADPFQGDITDDIRLAVANVFDGNISVLEVPTTHFASNYPYWTEYKVNRGSIGRHQFYY